MTKKTVKDFSQKEIWEIATHYANTDFSYSHEYFSKEYDISQDVFYNLLEKAVSKCIVSDYIVKKMAIKAATNAKSKAGEAGEGRSRRHYENLIKKRKSYMLPKETAINLTISYANCVTTREKFLRSNFIDKRLFERTLLKAIIENWVSDEVVTQIKEKSLRTHDEEKTIKFWDKILQIRKNKKNQG